MKAISFIKPRMMELVEVDTPKINENEVLCRIKTCGICGSDLHIWEGVHWIPETWPMPPGGHGHETGAKVIEVGSNVRGIAVGDKVARMGRGYAECSKEVNVIGHGFEEDKRCLPIVCNELTYVEISFADPLGCAINCIVQSRVEKGGTVTVLGQGPIGLLMTQLFVNKEINVVSTDLSEKKLDLSRKFGAEAIYADRNYVHKILKEAGQVDCIIETVGSQSTLMDSIELVKAGGLIFVFGAQGEIILPYKPLRQKGVEMRFPEAMVDTQRKITYWNEALRMLKKRTIDVHSLITARKKLQELPEIFANYDKENWIKIIVEP